MRTSGARSRRFSAAELTGVFLFGGVMYGFLEILFRSYTHWSMVLTGGVCFTVIYLVHLKLFRTPLLFRCLLGGGFITLAEFAVGCLVNRHLGWAVWDYTALPGNLLGQISLLFTLLWCLLCLPAAPLSKWLRRRFRRFRLKTQNLLT